VISPATPYVYDTTPDFQQAIEAEAYFAVQHGFKKLGVMEQQQWAGSETALATAYVKKHFGASIVTYQYSPPTATDQTAQLQALKSDGVQAILSYESPSGTLLEAQEEKTVVFNVPIFDNQCSSDTHGSLNKLGVTTTCATYVKANSSLPAYQSEIAAAQRFGFVSIAKDDAGAFVNGYIAADVLAQAAKSCGAGCTPARFNSALQSMTNFSTGGLSNPISFSASQHNMLSTVYPWTLQSDGTQQTGTGIVVAP
jgi:ABC-type branched-subunit amino acid transport system substrate-binding protein